MFYPRQVNTEIETCTMGVVSGVLWVGGLENKAARVSGSSRSVVQCSDTNRENMWALLVLVSEKVLLCPSSVGVLTLSSFRGGALLTFL